MEPLEKNWSCYRAAVLVILLQGGRVSTIADKTLDETSMC
jgi:hypothetical protein